MLTRPGGQGRAHAPISRRPTSLAAHHRRVGPEDRGRRPPIDLRRSAYGLHPTDSQHCSRIVPGAPGQRQDGPAVSAAQVVRRSDEATR
jgi:hypothetical protein